MKKYLLIMVLIISILGTTFGAEMNGSNLTKKPKMIGNVEVIAQKIEYPEIMKLAGLQGVGIYELSIDTSGVVTDVNTIQKTYDGLDEEAIRVLKQTSFEPALENGKKVNSKYRISVRFKL